MNRTPPISSRAPSWIASTSCGATMSSVLAQVAPAARVAAQIALDTILRDPPPTTAANVAAKTGDARSALDICDRAISGARADAIKAGKAADDFCVNIPHILSVMRAIHQSPYVKAIRALPQQSQFVLIAALRLAKKKKGRATANDVYKEYRRMCSRGGNNLDTVPWSAFSDSLLSRLQGDGLVRFKGVSSRTDARQRKVELSAQVEDIETALQDSAIFKRLMKG